MAKANMKSYSYWVLLVIFFFCKAILALNNEDSGTTLFLTNLIEAGNIPEARQRARVYHAELQNIESYAGYFTVDKQYNSNLFFWYFPSQSKPESDPVVLWLQGGPGSPSLQGLLTGNGPIAVSANNTLEFRQYSWNLNHNVIYIDNPIGAGYSFTDNELGYSRTDESIARNLYEALNQFYELFPELRSNQFFASGESYGAKYVLALSNEIKNRNTVEKKKINLVGMTLGSGRVDPINQIDCSDYLYGIGLVDENGRETFKKAANDIKDLIRKGQYVDATELIKCTVRGFCKNSNTTLFERLTGFENFLNYKYQTVPEEIKRYETWVQKTSVRKAIHVGNQNFTAMSNKAFEYLSNTYPQSLAPVLADLLQHYRTLIYAGQLDIIGNYLTVENYLSQLKWTGAEEYKTALRKQWWIDSDLAGYSKKVQNLTEVLVRNAGHMSASDQPFWVWKLISHFTRQEDL